MTNEQRNHRIKMLNLASQYIFQKYTKGANEHKTLLSTLSLESLIDNAIDEAVDQLMYLLTIKHDKLNQKSK